MRKSNWVIVVGSVVAVASGMWIRGQQHQHHRSEPHRDEDFVVSTERSFTELMDEAMTLMHEQMKAAPRTGDPDRDFAAAMIPHHQGAINMAKALLLYGKDEQMKRLAQQIITEQQYEIELMKLWLKRHKHTGSMRGIETGFSVSKEEKAR